MEKIGPIPIEKVIKRTASQQAQKSNMGVQLANSNKLVLPDMEAII